MRAAVMRKDRLVIDELPVPEPRPGEVLVKTLAAGKLRGGAGPIFPGRISGHRHPAA